eukprot:scaffold22741_cov59-Attheya_sp.AAC.1
MERTVFSPLHTPTAAFGIGENNGSLDLGSLVDSYQTGLGPWRAFQQVLLPPLIDKFPRGFH